MSDNITVPSQPRPFMQGAETATIPTPEEATFPFEGYALPTSNTTYTPNQFFDVVLPYSSRGCVRLVAYLIRQTLGWSDAEGKPLRARISISHRELAKSANISRGALSAAIREALDKGFIEQVIRGEAAQTGSAGQSGAYQLRWDRSGTTYATNPDKLKGFFAGEGNRTYIPNAFFDHTIRNESLSFIRTVGALIRNTIGWQNEFGFRRTKVKMSFAELGHFTRLSPRHLNQAIKEAIKKKHIIRLESGVFDTNAGRQSDAATYGIYWHEEDGGSKRIAGELKSLPSERIKKDSGGGSKRIAEERIKKDSDIKITITNNILKQQQQKISSSSEETDAVAELSFEKLMKTGFDKKTAEQLAITYPVDVINNQCEWLPLRKPCRNKLGMLRRAIEENWPKPEIFKEQPLAAKLVSHFYAALAGNTGESLTEPTALEIELAEKLASRLTGKPVSQLAAEKLLLVGKKFGNFVRVCGGGTKDVRLSFRQALRLYGDEFASKTAAANETRKTGTPERRTSPVQRPLESLEQLEAELRLNSPALFENFIKAETEQRARIEAMPMVDKTTIAHVLAAFDNEESRVQRVQRFLEKRDLQKGFAM